MKLSIIVPVYNMNHDGNLQFCLDSLVNQTIDDYEIIAVDDASTDDSLCVLREYEQKYPEKFKAVAYSDNRKQGGAKNEGLKIAVGNWIGFVDSDDWVSKDCYEKLIEKAEKTGADLVGCNYSIVYSHTFEVGEEVKNFSLNQVGEFDVDMRRKYMKHPGSMVVKIYKGDVIRNNKLNFPEGIFYEDNCAALIWAVYFKHYEVVDEPMYYYYQHDTSTVHTITVPRCEDRLKASEMMLEEMKRRGFFEEYRQEIESNFTTTYFVNTLFSYMRIKHGKKISFVKRMKDKMLKEFPNFRSNPEYGRHMDDEQKKYVDILMKSTLRFFVQYSLLWAYRDIRNKR